MRGTVITGEFIVDDDDERGPGTYITIRLDDPDAVLMPGRVDVKYLPINE